MAITEESFSTLPSLSDILGDIRTSKMKRMPNLQIETGIDKLPRSGRIPVNELGLDEDEHDLTFHGGLDKAIHHYDSTHYESWTERFPASAHRFQPGGFGENFSTRKLNEKNVCIGDIWRVGNDGVLLQVSLPRQPCFKLNHRFQIRNFAPQTIKHKATGWYYRVLSGGSIAAGDAITLVERKYPAWTIERLQHFAHHEIDNLEALETLSAIEEMGDEARGMFKHRLAQKKIALEHPEPAKETWLDFKVVLKKLETPRVVRIELERVTPLPPHVEIPDIDGAFVRLRLANGLERCYSIVTGDGNKFTLGIARDDQSRGGSQFIHDTLQVGDIVPTGVPTSSWAHKSGASNHIFIAGGIGITAFAGYMPQMHNIHLNLELHYAVRSAEEVAFKDLVEKLEDRATIYDGSKGQRIDIKTVLANRGWNAQIYVCGPRRLLDAVRAAAKELDIPSDEIHYEEFKVEAGGDPFDVVVRRVKPADAGIDAGIDAGASKEGEKKDQKDENGDGDGDGNAEKSLRVPADKSLLQVLREAGFDVASSCEVGTCGTCEVTVCSGKVEKYGVSADGDGDDDAGEGDEALSSKRKTLRTCVDRGIGKLVLEVDEL